MPGLDDIKIQLEGIGHLLIDNKLVVPRHQRSYAWKEEHVKALFEDYSEAIRKKNNEYFLGTIVHWIDSAGGNLGKPQGFLHSRHLHAHRAFHCGLVEPELVGAAGANDDLAAGAEVPDVGLAELAVASRELQRQKRQIVARRHHDQLGVAMPDHRRRRFAAARLDLTGEPPQLVPEFFEAALHGPIITSRATLWLRGKSPTYGFCSPVLEMSTRIRPVVVATPSGTM